METWGPVDRGVHVPEYIPAVLLTGDNASGGSPLEKVATICPLEIALPQSSSSSTDSGVGQEAGVEKLFTRPVCVGASACGVHLPAGLVLRLSSCALGPGSGFSTINVTFTVGAAALVNEKLTPP